MSDKDKEAVRLENCKRIKVKRSNEQGKKKEQELKKIRKDKRSNQEKETEKQEDRQRKRVKSSQESDSDLKRLNNFQAAVRYGAIFTCNSCYQNMFRNGVSILDTVKLKKKGLEIYNKVFNKDLIKAPLSVMIDKKLQKSNHAYICTTCKRHLKQGKVLQCLLLIIWGWLTQREKIL